MKHLRFFIMPTCSILTMALFTLFSSCDEDESRPVPEVTSITPASGLPNSMVAISGKYFHSVFSENKVKFNGKDALVSGSSTTQLTVLVPRDAETGPVTISVNGISATNQPVFTVEAFPSLISTISPTSGRFGTEVTIAGSNFISPASSNVVSFNGVQAVVKSGTTNSLTVTVPERAGSGVVVVNGITSNAEFTYTPDIFVGGYERDGLNPYAARLWKNGKITMVSQPGQNTTFEDVVVVNDDIHVIGNRMNGSVSVVKYWKNNIEIPLALGSNHSYAYGIAVVGNDVYIAGSEFNTSNISVAKYWKNGNPVLLSDGKQTTYANGIAVSGNDVYVSGFSQDAGGRPRAMYWKNGVAFPLVSGDSNTDAFAIVVKGNDVYVAGSDWGAPGNSRACYWKNGTFVPVSMGAAVSYAIDIAVAGDDVYVAGCDVNKNFKIVGKYWKNGNPTILTDGTNTASVSEIDVIGNDVYVGGTEYNAGGIYTAKYWKNGVPVILTDGSNHAYISAMAVR